MSHKQETIPRPLVRINQWFILLSVVITWITGISLILILPLLSGVMALLFNVNPVMKIAKLFLKDPPNKYVLEDRKQQQFNQWIATILLGLALLSAHFNFLAVFWITTIMLAMATFIAILGFCIGCYIRYNWSQFQYRRSQKNSL
ncbi:DUF4395 domain-containing protein [Pseudalkalibacillus sp. SCS-8]|uniref:DUF4395 domain-containing protein n=1 Tax=Pseudalkalibacillus nanhaiensis TaxID=3115291 RepID=UPI0032DA4CAD